MPLNVILNVGASLQRFVVVSYLCREGLFWTLVHFCLDIYLCTCLSVYLFIYLSWYFLTGIPFLHAERGDRDVITLAEPTGIDKQGRARPRTCVCVCVCVCACVCVNA